MYNTFAKYYDVLMADVDYKARVDYFYGIFCRFSKKPTLLLDLACGTGGISNEFASRGISVIGVDISEEMLSFAQEKSRAAGLDVMYLCQGAAELDLYGTVDGAVCCLDSLNHITDYKEFCRAIAKVSLFLEKDSLFIFDMNTTYKHKKVLGDNTFVIEEGDLYCVWQNAYYADERLTEITLDFFERSGDSYIRSTENFFERAYTDREVIAALKAAGLELIAVYGDMKYAPPQRNEERKIFVAKKL
ncbi:MAG: methyltransferase domain-containing protein [Clostridia bacterium]|nr:methyltransferase domain-containing protein [Clostridia bacterium]